MQAGQLEGAGPTCPLYLPDWFYRRIFNSPKGHETQRRFPGIDWPCRNLPGGHKLISSP
jgi:hypothetical protein